MRKLFFLFPEMDMQQGGHTAQLKFLELSKRFCHSEAVTYKGPEAGTLFLDDLLKQDREELRNGIFVIHWGPHVPALLKRLRGLSVVYVAHSTGWGFNLPDNVPILAVSRHTQSYWATRAPNNPIFHLPNIIDEGFYSSSDNRYTDVLVMKRKTSRYVLEELVPQLKRRCKVKVIEGWVSNVADEMRNSKIFLYDSSEYWAVRGVSEGFGLPPLEALACGCQLFSSLNHALSDYLDPEVNCQQINVSSANYDCERIIKSLEVWPSKKDTCGVVAPYRSEAIAARMSVILPAINQFIDSNLDQRRIVNSNNKNQFLSTGLPLISSSIFKLNIVRAR